MRGRRFVCPVCGRTVRRERILGALNPICNGITTFAPRGLRHQPTIMKRPQAIRAALRAAGLLDKEPSE